MNSSRRDRSVPVQSRTRRLASCSDAIFDVVPRTMQRIRHVVREHHGNAGLTESQLRLLLQVERRPGTSLSTLATHLGVSRPSASVLVDRLVRAGYIDREDDPTERRRISLRITEQGRSTVKAARLGAQDWLANELAKLSDDQLADLESAINILGDVAPARPRRASPEGG